ncbi:MAG: hypothetical protein HOE69_03130 [Euryarchaeota archaeon]|jgi:hypothetical protein|nr:hypothetical protein [Euryarchaeota archaeon]
MVLDQATAVAWSVVSLVAAIVLYDGYRLLRTREEISVLGKLASGGYAWESDSNREVLRNGTSLATLGFMMVLPWPFIESSGTPEIAVILYDILLAMHCMWLMMSKRYAVSRTHLFADGFQYSWEGLRWVGWKGGNRIVLQRKGWWIFAPMPVGGSLVDLEQVAARIEALESDEWHLFSVDSEE